MTPSSVYSDSKEAKTDIIENAYKLGEFTKPEAFETYEELKSKMKFVLEAYNPEFVDPVQFKNIVAGIIDATPAETPVQETPQAPVQAAVQETPAETSQAPVQETPVAADAFAQDENATDTTPAASDDSLSFLDDL